MIQLRLKKYRLLLLLPSILLAGCQWFSWHKPISTVLPILSPDSLGQSLVALQKVSGERAGSHYTMLFQVEVDQQRLVLVGSSATGNSLFSVEYKQGALNSNVSPLLPAQLDPRYVLADFQLVFWPASAINQQLIGSDYRLVDHPLRRELWQAEELLIAIDYSEQNHWQGLVYFDNKRWDYRYTIETLQRQILPTTTHQEKP